MTTTFTPGPWFTHREGFSTVYVEARIRPGVIQEVAACGPTEAGQDQQEANARLIAMSPDLLNLLNEAVELQRKNYGDGMILHMDMAEWAKKAEAVIAKSTGEQT